MKLIRQLGRVIFTLGAKSGDNKVSITVKPFKNIDSGRSYNESIQSSCKDHSVHHPRPVH
jgi:hypothetical protein